VPSAELTHSVPPNVLTNSLIKKETSVTVTTARRVLGLWMEVTASRYGGYLRIYSISSSEQPARGGPWGCGLGGGANNSSP